MWGCQLVRFAVRSLDMLNFTPLNGKPVRVMSYRRDPSVRKSGSGNIFIKNLDKSIDHKALHDTFSAFGNILSCKVATDASGQSKGYGFVQFEHEESAMKAIENLNGMLLNDKQVFVGPFVRKLERDSSTGQTKFNNSTDDAARAVEALNGKKFDDREWYVGKAQKKSEREAELKYRFEQTVKEVADKNQGANLYVKNLDDTISEEVAQRKEDRRARLQALDRWNSFELLLSSFDLVSQAVISVRTPYKIFMLLVQAQFSQLRPVGMAPPVGPRMPMYPPGGPQQIFYGQAPPPIIPPQDGRWTWSAACSWDEVQHSAGAGSASVRTFTYPLVEALEAEAAANAKVRGMLLEMSERAS
ncbi:hypothetical protein ACFE04_022387 [Oxalis oulophora]